MTIENVRHLIREKDFAEFVQYADEEELLRQCQLIRSELARFENVRTPVTELLRDRLSVLTRTLGLAA